MIQSVSSSNLSYPIIEILSISTLATLMCARSGSILGLLPTTLTHKIISHALTVAIKAYGHVLTDFEESEIVSYPQIWYVGQTAKKVTGKPGAPNNNGQ